MASLHPCLRHHLVSLECIYRGGLHHSCMGSCSVDTWYYILDFFISYYCYCECSFPDCLMLCLKSYSSQRLPSLSVVSREGYRCLRCKSLTEKLAKILRADFMESGLPVGCDGRHQAQSSCNDRRCVQVHKQVSHLPLWL